MTSRSSRITASTLLAALLAWLPLLPAQAASSGCAALPQVPATLEIDQGLQQEVRLPVKISRAAVGDPRVADVHPLGNDAVLITAMGAGATSLSLWTSCASGPRQTMVFVRGRAAADQASTVLPPSMDGELPNQVQADIRFVEVSRTKLKEAGAKLFFNGSNNSLFGAPGTVPGTLVSPGQVPVVPGGATVPLIPLNNNAFNIVWGGGSSRFLAAINALENSGFAYTLARPSLVVLSGMTASFLAGGEIPIPVPSSGSDSVSIEYKEFGIRLALSPTVVSRDRIHLKVAPEVSELDDANAVEVAGTRVPALSIRRTDTSISLADGESFVISGLISSRTSSSVDKFPGLGDIPILGAFFRQSRVQRDETELLMVVTPHLVRPLAANAQLPELPGEQLRNYDPSWGRLFFLENGDFDRRSGLSR
ncbi:type II and III secretion system protein family protein [Pseudomonas sp. zfem002]|uniref:type II and III secretion system protein family protein n=1 Tax=Pseudomonas sp. zfem002 TaxID=3078197 RepID=UPI00292A1BB0|nr:type II and III secretion system protein family protein [Pseudomonas sp. zfem002]MDU9394248.1 type II and III secretion system protein family protein [Pseudomonas sp. zfem002]